MKRLPPREGYDLYARDYRKDHAHLDSFMNGAESQAWQRALDDRLALPSVIVLDAGCGDGRTLGRWVRAAKKRGVADRVVFHGADLSPKMLEAARARVKGPRWHQLDLGSPSQTADWSKQFGPADVVSAFFVLVHFARVEPFFAAMRTLLAPGGRLVMNTLPQPEPPELQASGKPIVIEAWDHRAEDVIAGGEAAGLTLLSREDFFEKGDLVSTLLEWKK
jgi:ubiquinone/menaquinone biosynthesis C-methylase UbiE